LRKNLKNELVAKNTLIESYKSQIPSDWPSKYKDFQSLIKKEKIERSKYRRLMDGSYNEIFKLYTILNLKDIFFKFDNKFKKLSAKLEVNDPKKLINEIKLFTKELNKIPDNRDIISTLNKVNRSLKKKKIDYVKVNRDFKKAYNLYMKKNNSLKMIDNKLVSELENYIKIVSTSIGVRQQGKLPKELAIYLADCRASHKNLTLFF